MDQIIGVDGSYFASTWFLISTPIILILVWLGLMWGEHYDREGKYENFGRYLNDTKHRRTRKQHGR